MLWVAESLLVQRTVVPTLTVNVPGLNEKFSILISLLPGAGFVCALWLAAGAVDGAEDSSVVGAADGAVEATVGDAHEASINTERRTMHIEMRFFFMFLMSFRFCLFLR